MSRLGVIGWVLVGVVAAALATGCDYVRSQKSLCEERLAPTRLRVVAAPVDYTTDFTRSSEELKSMGATGADRVALGLTRTRMKSTVTLGSNSLLHPVTKRYCLRPTIEVAIAFDPTVVYISRDQQQGTCEFGITMEHEMRHVNALREFLRGATTKIGRDLRQHVGDTVFYFATADDADKRVDDDTRAYLAPIVDTAMQQIAAMQKAIDTPQEYDRLAALQKSCAGE